MVYPSQILMMDISRSERCPYEQHAVSNPFSHSPGPIPGRPFTLVLVNQGPSPTISSESRHGSGTSEFGCWRFVRPLNWAWTPGFSVCDLCAAAAAARDTGPGARTL
ncbi:hypothetical protein OIU79_004669 [Salix purpurea]|uniref:Uncharacterized protein n=1 Tax=Salix purpurea TaxID=77065 RepID=A0A9Q0Z9U7_SALPP|nr:hypothetical protein OIU79_004669 [Salix purpurea]